MSLNNIELGTLLVSELYQENLLKAEAAALPPRVVGVPGAGQGSGMGLPESGNGERAVAGSTDLSGEGGRSSAERGSKNSAIESKTMPEGGSTNSGRGSKMPEEGSKMSGGGSVTLKEEGSVRLQGSLQTSPSATGGERYKYLGNNRRRIVLLVQSPGVPFLPDEQLNFLTKMLEACKMNVGDVAIVNLASGAATIAGLKEQLQPGIILLFGMEPVAIKLPMSFPPFKIQAYDECTYLCAPSLEALVRPGEDSKLLKSKLWVCLKTLFAI